MRERSEFTKTKSTFSRFSRETVLGAFETSMFMYVRMYVHALEYLLNTVSTNKIDYS